MTTVTFNFPTLPDNDVWWANFAAWVDYWDGVASIEIAIATPTEAGAVLQAATTIFTPDTDAANLVIDGAAVVVPLQAAFLNLLNDYVALKTALKNAGIISNA